MKAIDCPICKKRVEPEAKTFPFCSERCRLIDLGHWLGGRYAIAGDEPPSSDDKTKPPSDK
jgi:endogenous inhibitor of DNA gyrase (YacG/DUF329 family)